MLFHWRLVAECLLCNNKSFFVEITDCSIYDIVIIRSNLPDLVHPAAWQSDNEYIVLPWFCYIRDGHDLPVLSGSKVLRTCFLRSGGWAKQDECVYGSRTTCDRLCGLIQFLV
mmetsp:Transcript_6669/g.14195  ORF Transcript_6669/g.14195 Transcript_6669/m.14195 type:complete len:113 (+) Transcript_6669:170-508(+)